MVALKVIDLDYYKEDFNYEDLLSEIKIHSLIDQPNIIKLYGFFKDYKEDVMVLILEYANLDLFNFRKKQV